MKFFWNHLQRCFYISVVIATISPAALAQTVQNTGVAPKSEIEARLAPIQALESPKPLGYVMALLRDRRGFLWVGTEGSGLWRYDQTLPADKAWTQFTTKNGLGDDYTYSLLEDFQGRIWVGHATSGVSVWNGQKFANYSTVENEDKAPKGLCGPLGERIFSMAIRPANGDVFLATNEGVSIYSSQNDRWSYRTRRDGLPSNQIQAIAFDSFDTVYVGTQCDGIAKSNSDSNFTNFTTTSGPAKMPDQLAGEGLPSSQINDLLVAEDNTIFAATKRGLARSNDLGNSWTFLRGVDWQKQVLGRTVATVPQPRPEGFNREALREDYITNLVEDQNGLLLLAFRARGYEARRPLPDHNVYVSLPLDQPDLNYVSAILPQRDGAPIVGFYGDGLKIGVPTPSFVPNDKERDVLKSLHRWKQTNVPPLSSTIPKLPASAEAPSATEIENLLRPLSGLKNTFPVGGALYEGDDWRTKGDWIGRYGRNYAVLCATRAPLNHYVTLDPSYQVDGFIGTHFKGNDSLRHWVHWMKSDNPNVLYNPVIGYRRQAEWDDHGETYPYEFEGPDVWAKVQVPEGVHRMSLYFFNKDGRYGNNRARDYALEIKAGVGANGKAVANVKDAENAPILAKGRVRDFWNGVYKRFLVRGPSTYWVKIGRDGSFNTILSSVMLDKIVGPRTWADSMPLNYMGRYEYTPPAWESMANISALEPIVQRTRIWDWKIDSATTREGGLAQTDGLRVLVLRHLMAQPKNAIPPQLLARWRWKSAIWNQRDRTLWNKAMPEAREAFFVLNPEAREVDW